MRIKYILWILLNIVYLCFAQSLPSANETEGEQVALNETQVKGRGSRQLWSLLKNVVKSSLDSGSGNGNNQPNSVSGLGALASLFSGAVQQSVSGSNGINTNYYEQLSHNRPYATQSPPPTPNQYTNPNEYMHWLLLNQNQNQHASLPYFQQQKKEPSIQELIDKYKDQLQSSGSENAETVVGSVGADSSTGSQIINKLAFGSILDNLDLDNLGNLLSFGRFEEMVSKVNKFDRLKCIPRLLCQMVAKRQEDSKTTTTTERPSKAKRRNSEEEEKASEDKSMEEKKESRSEPSLEAGKDKVNKVDEKKKETNSEEDDEDTEDDDDSSSEEGTEYKVIKKEDGYNNKRTVAKRQEDVKTTTTTSKAKNREARLFKLNGADAALEQFVKFLELMQLKDWSLYPYIHGAYQGHQVSRSEDCAYRFSTCPFSDDQLVYYFNNYNNGIFHSIF